MFTRYALLLLSTINNGRAWHCRITFNEIGLNTPWLVLMHWPWNDIFRFHEINKTISRKYCIKMFQLRSITSAVSKMKLLTLHERYIRRVCRPFHTSMFVRRREDTLLPKYFRKQATFLEKHFLKSINNPFLVMPLARFGYGVKKGESVICLFLKID